MTLRHSTCALALDVKALSEDGTFEGYASVFGERDSYGDIVAKGAFKASLKARPAAKVKMLLDHNPAQRLGVWTSMKEDDHGLLVAGKLFVEKQIAREAHIDMKGGALSGLSIGYRTKSDAFDRAANARILKEIDLFEVSAVTFPALESAQISAVKAADEIKTIREFEMFLRDAGFSNAHAKAIASHGFKAAVPRDEDESQLATSIRRVLSIIKS